MNIDFLREIKKLRQDLHKIPELSFAEEKTKKHLIDWLCENTDLDIICSGLKVHFLESEVVAIMHHSTPGTMSSRMRSSRQLWLFTKTF